MSCLSLGNRNKNQKGQKDSKHTGKRIPTHDTTTGISYFSLLLATIVCNDVVVTRSRQSKRWTYILRRRISRLSGCVQRSHVNSDLEPKCSRKKNNCVLYLSNKLHCCVFILCDYSSFLSFNLGLQNNGLDFANILIEG